MNILECSIENIPPTSINRKTYVHFVVNSLIKNTPIKTLMRGAN